MKEEIRKWWEQANRDLKTAMILLENKRWDAATFYCQQSVEKALKAYSLKKGKRLRKIHDLVILGRDVNLPQELLDFCKELTLAYIYCRYPDIKSEQNIRGIAIKFLKYAEEILKWIGKNL